MRHVPRTQRVNVAWLDDASQHDGSIDIKYVKADVCGHRRQRLREVRNMVCVVDRRVVRHEPQEGHEATLRYRALSSQSGAAVLPWSCSKSLMNGQMFACRMQCLDARLFALACLQRASTTKNIHCCVPSRRGEVVQASLRGRERRRLPALPSSTDVTRRRWPISSPSTKRTSRHVGLMPLRRAGGDSCRWSGCCYGVILARLHGDESLLASLRSLAAGGPNSAELKPITFLGNHSGVEVSRFDRSRRTNPWRHDRIAAPPSADRLHCVRRNSARRRRRRGNHG